MPMESALALSRVRGMMGETKIGTWKGGAFETQLAGARHETGAAA